MELTTSQKIIGAVLAVVILIALYVTLRGGGPDLEGMLRSGDPEKQIDAILKLEREKSDEAVELITEFSSDPNERIARRCIIAMGRMTEQFTEEMIAEKLQDSRESIREATVIAIGSRGRDGNPGILRQVFLDTENPEGLRSAAARELGGMSDWDSMGSLIRAMNDPSRLVRGTSQKAVEMIYGRWFPETVYSVDGHPDRRERFIASFLNEYKHYQVAHEDYMKRKQESKNR